MRIRTWVTSLTVALATLGSASAAESPPQGGVLSPKEIADIRSYVGRPLGTLVWDLDRWGAIYRVVNGFSGPVWALYDERKVMPAVYLEENLGLAMFRYPERRAGKLGHPKNSLDGESLEEAEGRYIFGHSCPPNPHVFWRCEAKSAFIVDAVSGHIAFALYPLKDPATRKRHAHPVMFIRSCAPPEFADYARRRFAAWENVEIGKGDLDYLVPFTIERVEKVRCRARAKPAAARKPSKG